MPRTILSIVIITVVILIASFAVFSMMFRSPKAVEMQMPKPVADTEPETMSLSLKLPKDEGQDTLYQTVKNRIILVLKADSMYVYEGNGLDKGKSFTYSSLKNLIRQGNEKFLENFVIVIKPSEESSYKNVVDVLDEMRINKVKRYTVTEMSQNEIEFLKVGKIN